MSKVKARGLRVLLAVAAAVLLVLGFCLWTPVTKTRAADGQIMTANDLMLAIYNVQDGGTVTLGADIALDLNQDGGITGGEPGGHMYIPTRATGAYSFTLDLNGNTITIDTVSGFGCIEVQSGVTVTVKNGTLAGKSNGNFACGAAGSSISLENVTIDFEGLNQEVKPAIATDGALAVSNVTFDLVNAEAIDENTAVTYQTLWDELNLAADGAVVSLKENAVLDKQFKFTEGKKLTLDLGEYTLAIGEGMGNVCALDVRSGSLTIRAGAKGAIDGTQADETTVPVGVMAQGATLTIESGTIKTDTKYESCVYAGFGGIVYIEGGKFVNLCEEPFAYDQTSPALAVNVHDGTSGQQMVISGGTFVGRNPVLGDTNVNRTESYMAADAKVAGMADGSFVAFAGEEVPEGAVAVYAQSADEVSAEVYTAEALAAALADGNFETVVLGADITASVSVERTVTLDLNGKTLTNVAGKHTIENYGTLTVIGEGTVDNVSHGRGAVVNYGTAYLNGGLYTRSLENGQSSEDSGGNSWYVLKNYGSMTIDGAKVTQDGHYSSMIANGYQNAGDRNTNYGKVTTADKVPTLVIESGEFVGGMNTVKNDDYAVMTINGGTFKNVSQAAVLNWNELTITDGVFEVGEAAQAAIITSYAAGGYDNGTTTISGGTFKGAVTVDAGAANVKYSISGGNYSVLPKAEYFAEGFAAAWDEETQAYVTQEGSYVAAVGEYGYTTLAEAIAAADGETVKLIADVTENVTIEKSVTIDLNGYSISSAQGYAIDVIGGLTQEEKIEVVILSTGEQGTIGSDSNNVGLNVKNFADVTVENVYAKGSIYGVQMGDNGSAYQTVVTMKDSKAEGTGFAGVYVMGTSNAEQPVTLKAENSEFIGYWYGVTGNGTYHNTYIELVNCTVTGTAGDPDSTNYTDMGYGIYHPQDGTLIIDGGTVTGVSAGIEIRSGKLVVKGGAQITGTCKTLYIVENGSGTTVSGAAVAVSQHSTQKPIDVTIEEGTLTGLYALYETDTYATATPSENVEISITGGTLVGEIHSDNKTGFISGGNYSELPKAEYFAEGFAAVPNAEGGYDAVSEEDYMVTLTVNDTRIAYATLAEAVAAVPADDSEALIEFVGTAQEYSGAGIIVEAGRNIIIDFNNNTYIVTTTVGSSGTETNRFQLKKGSQVVMKDGTIKTSAEISGILIQKYNELTLENMVLDLSDNAQIAYVISNNNGTTTITGNTQIIAAAGKAAFDTYHWPDNGYGAVEVIFDAGFTGKVEGRIEYTTDGTDPEWQSETKLTFADGNTGTYDVDFYIMDGEENANVTISDGTFKKQVPYELYAEGFVGVWDEEAQAYVTQEGSYVATIDGYGYLTLDAAIKSVGASETAEIVLIKSIENEIVPVSLENILDKIPEGKYTSQLNGTQTYYYFIGQEQKITLDLNGNSITFAGAQGTTANGVSLFLNAGDLIVKDSKDGGYIKNTIANNGHFEAIFWNLAGANLYLESGIYNANLSVVNFDGTVQISGAELIYTDVNGQPATECMSVIFMGGTLKVKEGAFVQGVLVAMTEANFEIEGGRFAGSEGFNDSFGGEGSYSVVSMLGGSNVTVTGGTFESPLYVDSNSALEISGGVFAEPVAAKYLAEGYVFSVQDDKYVVVEGTAQTIVLHGEEEYSFASVADALVFAAEGDTVRLNADVTENVTIEKSVTIDLNGYSISSAQGYAIDVIGGLTQEEKIEVVILSTGEQGTIGSDSNNVGLNVKNFADVTVENVYAKGSIYGVQMGDNGSAYQTVVTMKDSKAEGTGFAGVYVMGTSNAEQPVTLKAENSEFIGYWYGVTGNGTYHNTYIELVNCTVTGTAGDPDSTNYTDMGYGIYHPQDGTLIIDGGTVTGVSAGIEIRSGKLVVKGGAQITGTCKTLYIVENGSGTTVSGAAVAVSQHSTQKPIDVTIEEGTLTGLYALYETDTYATATPSENVEISVTGGTLVGEIHSDNKAGFISGGRFSAQPAEEYFDPDYAAVYRDGWYVTVESTVLRVAQAQAQADVRMYAAALGLSWSDVESNAAQVIELYDAIAETFSEKAVVDAKLAAMEALEAYAEEVKAAQEEAAAAQALAQAKTAAQEEVRDYAAMLGTTWTAIANAEGAEAAAAVEKYNAIADAADTQGVADAKLAAKQAVEAYVAAVNAAEEEAAAAWAQTKQDAIAALEQWRDENAEGIVIPTSVYLAVNSAETQDELNTYIDSAKAELSDILTYRGQIAALAEDLGKQMTSLEELSATLTALDEALTGENNYFELQLTDIEEIVAKANAEIKQAVEDAQAAIVSGDADSESLASLKAYLETINNETLGGILTAVNGLGNELAGVDTALSGLSSQLSGLSGALTDVGKTIEESIAATQTKVQSIIDQLGSLATGDDITAVTGSLTAILEDIAKVQETVDAISVEVNVVTEVTEVKTQAYSDIKAWLDEYLDEIIGTDSASADVFTLRAYTPETTDGEIYAKLTKAFSEDNAKLVLKYYNEALASIDAAKTVSDVTTAVSTFKAQVASVEAAAQNTPDVNLTAVYVLLAVLLVGVVAAIVILLVRKAPAQAAVAEEAAPAPAEAKAEAEPVEEAKEAPAEEETAVSEAAAEDDDREQVVIAASVRTFSEAYEEMSEEDRDLFNKVREYALAKDDAKEVKQSTGVCVKRNGKQIVKLTIRRGAPVALFFLENEMLKDFRRATSTSAKLKVRATELVLREPADLDTAYMMVDLAVEQIEKDIENAKERRKEARRLRRLQKQAEEEAKAEDDKA